MGRAGTRPLIISFLYANGGCLLVAEYVPPPVVGSAEERWRTSPRILITDPTKEWKERKINRFVRGADQRNLSQVTGDKSHPSGRRGKKILWPWRRWRQRGWWATLSRFIPRIPLHKRCRMPPKLSPAFAPIINESKVITHCSVLFLYRWKLSKGRFFVVVVITPKGENKTNKTKKPKFKQKFAKISASNLSDEMEFQTITSCSKERIRWCFCFLAGVETANDSSNESK